MKTVTTIIAALVFAGAAFAQTASKVPKKILIGSSSLNHVDQRLIQKLKENGCEVVLVGPTNIEKVDIKTYPVKEGTVKADYVWGKISAQDISDYSAFIFTRTENAKALDLPVEEILRSNKLIVFGECPTNEAGEKLLRGGEIKWNYNRKVKPYQINGTPNRISYIVYRSNMANSQSEEDNVKFVDKLLIRIISNL